MGAGGERWGVGGSDRRGVAESSVMPKGPRGDLCLTTVMIGGRAGEWVRQGTVWIRLPSQIAPLTPGVRLR